MKWSIFGKKRLEFCAGKSSASTPPSPAASLAASPFRACTTAARSPVPTDYVGTRLFESSQPPLEDACSAEFLFDTSPARPHVLSPSAGDVAAAEAAEEASPLTPSSVRSCPEPEAVLGFCPNCHSVVVPLTKKRPHIRTNPWLWSKRARGATSVTDSGIFDPSPVTSAQESAQTPGTDTPVGPQLRRVSDSSSSDEDTLAERREQRRRYRKRRRKRRQKRKSPQEEENNENNKPEAIREEPAPLLLFPRARARLDKQEPIRTAFRPILAAAANQTESPVFRLPQSDCSELWEVRGEQKAPAILSHSPSPPPIPPGLLRPTPRREHDEDAMADAEVCEYSRRHVSHIRSSLRERIEQLKQDRVLLEERLQVTRGSANMTARQEECWTREVRDYRKQLLLRMLTSAKGQVHRHLDRLQDSYDALLLEKLNCALENADQRRDELV